MSQIMEKFDVLNELNDEFKQRVKILYVFQDYYSNKYNVLIVTKDDKTFAFGENSSNRLGFGHDKVVNEIQIVKELRDQQIIDFANGDCHCIARNSSGKVYCWGFNLWGLLGIGSQDESYHKPILNQYLNNEFVIDISCGAYHSLVLTNCGEVYAWGSNYCGEIGNGCNDNQSIPIKVKGFNNEKVVMISCGYYHSMALTKYGNVYSWGDNRFGQLGIGNTVDSNEPKFIAVIDENKCNVFIEKISCGFAHSLLLSSDGNIYTFGLNESGELGNQKEENELSPQRIITETKFIDISSHWDKYISIALSQNGNYYIWGKYGEEIIRKPKLKLTTKLTNFESFVDIYAKYLKITNKAIHFEDQNSVSILLRDKYANEFSHGNNKMSQIMEKFHVLNKLNFEFKQRVKILYFFENCDEDFVVKGYNVLIVTKDDKTYAFGNNGCGILGFGHDKVVNEIQIVEELCDKQIIDFANGHFHCIARNSSGKVYCWGCNDSGELGIGSQDESFHKPKLNQYLNNEFVIDISCGFGHSLVLTNCGEVFAWGNNYSGQIGNGCGIESRLQLNVWGNYFNPGQIGNGCNKIQSIPIKVKGFNNERVVMISCGWRHSMALTECGHVYSWGWNEFGQLGIGNTVKSNEPKFVAVIDENECNVFIEKISCGSDHSLLLSRDGYIYAFGWNTSGELGNQKEENELSPQRIKIETKFIDISSRWLFWFSSISIALSQDGIYYNWGKCGEEIIRTPKPTNFESFVEIYAKYFEITHKAINFEEQNSAPIPIPDQIKLQNKYANEFSEQSLISSGEYIPKFFALQFFPKFLMDF
jgi:alpha-tubulin suppressor-like RCC1 family protein